MNPTKAEKDLLEISKDRELIEEYNKYWESITPKTDEEIHRRYVFSFLSVHTPWSGNVSSFLLLEQNKHAYNNKEELIELIKESRAGNYTTKAKGIAQFSTQFALTPHIFKMAGAPMNPSQAYRTWLMKHCHGLGLAKTAFALEMCYPLRARTVCLDTHMLQLYGYTEAKERAKAGSNKKLYYEMEDHWIKTCDSYGIAPFIARAIWWDKKQQQKDSRYWSYVIE